MAVSRDLPTDQLLTRNASPTLREADKKHIVASRFALERQMIGVVRGGQTGKVGNVLAQDLVTVDGEIRKRTVFVVLRGQCFASCPEVLEILRCPPVGQTSLRIELAALIVEAVADFVSDGRAHRAEICRRVAIRIEVGCLKDRGGEVERIL